MSEPETVTPPVEGEPAAETVDEPAPAEAPAPAPADGDAPATETTEAKPAEEAKPTEPEITEEAIKAAAVRYANKTMAAARRAEARVEKTKEQNEALSTDLKLYKDFVQELRTSPLTAIRKLGFQSVRDFLDAGIAAGGEEKEPDPAQQVAALKKQWEEERAKSQREALVAKIDAVIEAKIVTDKTAFARTATKYGQQQLWAAISAYHQKHGQVPTEAVVLIAKEVERDLRADFGDPIPAPSSSEKKTTPAAAPAAPAARNGGKTLTNKQSSSAPVESEFSLDPEERRAQVNASLAKDGLL